MKKSKGFTLIELMIVVAIIGILAAIAIPNFLRYQLRSKASERKMNVEAIFKSEEAARQREGGLYKSIGPLPAGAVGSTKIIWGQNDYAASATLDWTVQGGTYGKYEAVADTTGAALAVIGWSDIDFDGAIAADGLWQPQIKGDGTQGAATTPTTPAVAGLTYGNNTNGGHSNTFVLYTDAPGQVTQLSADGVF